MRKLVYIKPNILIHETLDEYYQWSWKEDTDMKQVMDSHEPDKQAEGEVEEKNYKNVHERYSIPSENCWAAIRNRDS